MFHPDRTSRRLSALLTAALLTFAAAATLSAPQTARAEGQVIDRIVAKVNSDIITLNDLKRASSAHLLARRITPQQLEAAPNADEIYRDILQEMIDTRLLIQEAKALQLEVNEEDVNQWITNVRGAEGLSEDQFREELRARGIRWQDYRRYIQESLLKVRVVQIKVASRVSVSDAEVERAYTERYGAPPGEGIKAVDLSHIHIPFPEEGSDQRKADVQALVSRVMRDLRGGKPFSEVAKEVSTGPMADGGGHLGKFTANELQPEYRVVFDIEPGTFTDPIETKTGYHVFKVNDVFVERDPKVDSRLDNLRNDLLTEQRGKELESWLEQLRNRAYVKVMY